MRLTLRTLLAYLDDTLEPSEIKTIGQKVSESDAAQELVARIKQVTRRRRLTTPTDGGAGERFDPNRVAAYLDNDLTGEEIAELEKICLESDVHLAEIAATHQILTLVLGEPALVPPTAKRRMYALSHGRPKKAANKPAAAVKTAAQEPSGMPDAGDDDTLLALPLFRKAPWLRWAMPLAAVVLLGILGVVLWKTLGAPADSRATREKIEGDPPLDDKTKTAEKKPADKKADDSTKPADKDKTTDGSVKPPDKEKPAEKEKPADKDKKPDDKPKNPPEEIKTIPAVGKPSMEKQPLGRFVSKEQVLIQRDGDTWKRVILNQPVQTGEPLISLPGFKSEIRMDGKLDLVLWGSLPELFPELLLESSVTLHHNPPAGIDAEMTLHRGRTYLSNRKEKGEVRVRVRFWREETWDVVMEEPDTTVGVELMTIPVDLIPAYLPGYKPQPAEEPLVQTVMYVLKGRASLRAGLRTFGELRGPLGPALFVWNNKGRGLGGPYSIERKITEWEPDQPLPMPQRELDVAKRVSVALTELAQALTRPTKPVEAALLEYMSEKDPERRLVGIRSLVAIDAVGSLLDALSAEELGKEDVRREALFGLKNWLSRGLEQEAKLYDPKTKTGLLSDKGLKDVDARSVLELLHGFTPEERRQKETYEVLILSLRHTKMLIRDLAWRQLEFLAPGQKIDYHPAAPPEVRDRGADLWKKLLDTGKLPPPPPPMPPMPPK